MSTKVQQATRGGCTIHAAHSDETFVLTGHDTAQQQAVHLCADRLHIRTENASPTRSNPIYICANRTKHHFNRPLQVETQSFPPGDRDDRSAIECLAFGGAPSTIGSRLACRVHFRVLPVTVDDSAKHDLPGVSWRSVGAQARLAKIANTA